MKLTSLYLLVILFISCGNTRHEMDNRLFEKELEYEALTETPIAPQESGVNAEKPTRVSKKVIRSGQIRFQSDGAAEDYKKIIDLISDYDSYIDSENESNSNNQINYDISIRVDAKSFDSLFYRLSKISKKLDFKSSNVEDVSEKYYDLKTRIKNKKQLENRYIELLKKGVTIKDILEIERSINQVRNEIETAEGSFRYLSKKVSYSTIHLNFYEVLPSGYQPDRFWNRIIIALGRGWQGFLASLIGIAQYWPWLFIITGSYYFIKKIKSLRKKRNLNN